MPDEIAFTYEPQEGLYVSGIPQRDLTAADVEFLGPGMVAGAVASGLYRKATKAEKADAAEEAEKAEAAELKAAAKAAKDDTK
jgi:hypothetical protein